MNEEVSGDGVKCFVDVDGSEDRAEWLRAVEAIRCELCELCEVGSGAMSGSEAVLMWGEWDMGCDSREHESLKNFADAAKK